MPSNTTPMMRPSSSSPTPPSPCQYCYRYTPSTSSSAISACPISYFALTCNFTNLCKYPNFQNALMDIQSINGSKQKKQQRKQYNADDKREESNADAQAPPSSTASPLSSSLSTSHATFSTQITHNFNVSLTRALLNEQLNNYHHCPRDIYVHRYPIVPIIYVG